MKIGIVGSGHVGKTLANGLKELEHEVYLGTHTPAKVEGLKEELPGITVGDFGGACDFGELVIFAVRGSVAVEALSALAPQLGGKTVIDTTNPIADEAPTDGVVPFFTDLSRSLFEQLQEAAPDVKLVKAFNAVGSSIMVKPSFTLDDKPVTPTMFICGNDTEAKSATTKLLSELGWEAADMGSAVAARAIEPLCILWCIPGIADNDWYHAYKLLKK